MFRRFLFALLIFSWKTICSQNLSKLDSVQTLLENNSNSKKEYAQLLGDVAHFHNNLDSSLIYAYQSLHIAREINDSILIAQAWEEISIKHYKLGNNTESLKATFKALNLYEQLNLKENIGATYNQLASNYISEKNFQKGIDYLKKAIFIYSSSDKSGNKIFTILNLGETYRLAGYLDSAKVSLKEVLELNQTRKNPIAKSYSLGNLGMVYNTQDSLQKAKTHLNEAITILRELGDPYATSVYLAELGTVHQKEGQPQLAESKFLEAFKMAQEAGLKEQLRDFSEKLSQFYEKQGQYSKALAYQKVFQVYQDSLVNKANIQEIERLKAGYEIDKRESQIGLLNRANTNQQYFLWALGGGVLATSLFLFVLFRGNKRMKRTNSVLKSQKAVIEERENEKALLLRELNHRVKNNLQMISSLLNLQSNQLQGHPAKEALIAGKNRVEALSLVHRKLYQEGAETRIALNDYISELVQGLFYGYEANFEPELEIAQIDVPIDTAIPLSLIINELVTNALKYAFEGVQDPKFFIRLSSTNNELRMHLGDNGKGFDQEQVSPESFGLQLINALTEQLEGTFTKLPAKGTEWQLHFPFEGNHKGTEASRPHNNLAKEEMAS